MQSVYALIGSPVAHSLSLALHTGLFQRFSYSGVYLAFDVRDLAGAMRGVRALNIRGLSVTMPYKKAIMEYLDWIDPEAVRIDAVNTVVNDDGCLKGYNTDAYGASACLRESGYNLRGKTVMILGTGGTARALLFGIAERVRPERIVFVSRSEERVRAFLESVGKEWACRLDGVSVLSEEELRQVLSEASCIWNATPVGMPPHVDESPLPKECFSEKHLVFDVLYRPAMSKLLRDAQEQGATVMNGMSMFLHQGVRQFELWTKIKVPRKLLSQDTLLRNVAVQGFEPRTCGL